MNKSMAELQMEEGKLLRLLSTYKKALTSGSDSDVLQWMKTWAEETYGVAHPKGLSVDEEKKRENHLFKLMYAETQMLLWRNRVEQATLEIERDYGGTVQVDADGREVLVDFKPKGGRKKQ